MGVLCMSYRGKVWLILLLLVVFWSTVGYLTLN
nr:MAG TPA: hypothetical protein [Caudoviricetes sp.]